MSIKIATVKISDCCVHCFLFFVFIFRISLLGETSFTTSIKSKDTPVRGNCNEKFVLIRKVWDDDIEDSIDRTNNVGTFA